MSTTRTFRDLISRKVGNDLRGLKVDDFVTPAVRIYERHFPRIVTVDTTGDGTQSYATPANWTVGFSTIKAIEYPVGETPERFLDANDYRVVEGETSGTTRVQTIRFVSETPDSSEEFRMTHTARHTVSTSASSIDAVDEEAVADIGAGLLLMELATRLSEMSPQEGVAADIGLTLDGLAAEARANARTAFRRAEMALGVELDGEGATASVGGPVAAFADHDIPLHRGRGGLTHPHRWR